MRVAGEEPRERRGPAIARARLPAGSEVEQPQRARVVVAHEQEHAAPLLGLRPSGIVCRLHVEPLGAAVLPVRILQPAELEIEIREREREPGLD